MKHALRLIWMATFCAVLVTAWGCGSESSPTPPTSEPPAAPTPTPTPTPAADALPKKDPSPGPIIVLTPKDQGGKLMAAWTFDDDSPVPSGTDDAISIRFIGLIYGTGGFQLKKKADTTPLNPNVVELVLKSGQERTLRIKRDVIQSVHYFEWRFGSGNPVPLNVCDDVVDNCIADCSNLQQTLPSKAFGEIISIKVDGANLAPADLDWIHIQSDVQHPCP